MTKLTAEAAALITYVSGKKAAEKFVQKYVAALGQKSPLDLKPIFLRYPFLLRFLDSRNSQSELEQRLKLALLIAESDPRNIEQFTPFEKTGFIKAMLVLAGNGVLEIFLKIFRKK